MNAYIMYEVYHKYLCGDVLLRTWKVARLLISVSFGHDIRNNYTKFIIVCYCLWFVMSKYRFTEKDFYKYSNIDESDQKNKKWNM